MAEVRIKLSAEDLSEAVTHWARSKGLVRDGETGVVRLGAGSRSEGFGLAERRVEYAEVTITVETRKDGGT